MTFTDEELHQMTKSDYVWKDEEIKAIQNKVLLLVEQVLNDPHSRFNCTVNTFNSEVNYNAPNITFYLKAFTNQSGYTYTLDLKHYMKDDLNLSDIETNILNNIDKHSIIKSNQLDFYIKNTYIKHLTT
jgi:hypothetical protein